MNKKTICLIPAAGKGTRMQPLTYSLPKAMLTVAGKPILYHIIDAVAKEGIKDFIIIVGYLKELIESEVVGTYPNLNFTFVFQEEQKGLGHACILAEPHLQEADALMIIYGDTIFKANLKKMLLSSNPVIGVKEVEDPHRFGIVECKEKSNFIKSFIEKPENPISNLAIPGVNYFPNAKVLFNSIQYVIDNDIKTKGEYQITDAFSHMLDEGYNMEVEIIQEWLDAGTTDKLLETNQRLLEKTLSIHSHINSTNKIIEPVFIDKNVQIENSQIGPYVSIAQNCIIKDSKISNSIIDLNTEINNSILDTSLIGRLNIIKNCNARVLLGDKSKINNIK